MASFCVACGASLPEDARFCSACGKAVLRTGAAGLLSTPAGPLTRPRIGRKIAGVCRGLANRYTWDVTWTRVIAVLLAVFAFPFGLLAYGLFWLLMPDEPLALISPTSNLDTAT